jgi:(1->4)-alpha-D-glucan 1-alpha-D-glucosylmutase
VTRFVADIFTADRRRPFLTDLDEFARKIADHGRWNSLSQVVLKVASPGVPDFYQGTERWNLRLVDPDNRQPIDYAAGQQQLAELIRRMESGEADQRRMLIAELLTSRGDCRIKLFTTLVSLRLRRSLPELFTEGDYLPLAVHGPAAEHLVAIARRRGDQWALALAPRLTARLCGFGGPPPLGAPWAGTFIEVPPELSGRQLVDGFTGTSHTPNQDRLSVEALLAEFPVALMTGR